MLITKSESIQIVSPVQCQQHNASTNNNSNKSLFTKDTSPVEYSKGSRRIRLASRTKNTLIKFTLKLSFKVEKMYIPTHTHPSVYTIRRESIFSSYKFRLFCTIFQVCGEFLIIVHHFCCFSSFYLVQCVQHKYSMLCYPF